jgi:tetratricopeptide (TPR) repeat protein
MKFAYTLLLISFISLKLSASINSADTAKLPVPESPSDKLNMPDKLKLSSPANYSDSLDFSVAVLQKDNLKFQEYLPHPVNLNLSARVNHAGSPGEADPSNLSNNLKQVKLRNQDSLRLTALLMRQDSLKFASYRHLSDSVKQQLKPMSLDSLKQQLTLSKNNWFKGFIYTEITSRYLNYDTISNKTTRLNYQSKALSYTMMALHQYSSFNDTLGLRICFDNLAKVYFAQKKYSQAKWFILQSNTLSRDKNDVPDIIASLLTLSAIKSDIKDYKLAIRDLDEALQLSITNHYQKTELDVLKNYALLYSRLKNYPKEEQILKKRDLLQESIKKDEEAKLMASVNARALLQRKKADSLQNKKKVYTSNIRKLYKNNSSVKIASL